MALDPVTAILDIGGKVIDRLFPDPAQKAAAQLELFKLQQQGELSQIAGQMDINKQEAASSNAFVAGWRPFVGWVCGTGFAVQFVVGPLAEWGAALAGHPVKFPQMDMATMMPLLFGMLGLGAYRSVEKVKGVAS
ncbi:MAG TPA: holin family protein [Roseateles sp.]